MRLLISTLYMVLNSYIAIWKVRYYQHKLEKLLNK